MKYLLYPYSNSLCFLVQMISDYRKDISVTKLCAPHTWKKRFDPATEICYDFSAGLTSVDGVLIVDAPENTLMRNDIIQKISLALENKKNVLCCTELPEKDMAALSALAGKYNTTFSYIFPKNAEIHRRDFFQMQECIMIGVGGLLKDVDSFPVLTKLYQKYRTLGYRVTAVSADPNGALLGFVPFPSHVLDSRQPYDEIVFLLNSFFNNLQFLYQPDIVLFQVPNGMLRYSTFNREDYGIRTYILSQAISVDYYVLTVPGDVYNGDAIEQISAVFADRFGFPVRAVGMTDKCVDEIALQEEQRIEYEWIDREEIDAQVAFLRETAVKGMFFFDTLKAEDYDVLVQNSLDALAASSEI